MAVQTRKSSVEISACDFHGEPIAISMDTLAIALSEPANITERRIYQLISGVRGLPKFFVADDTWLSPLIHRSVEFMRTEKL